MTNISDATLVMRPDELRFARELSVARLEPPLHVPGYEQETFLGKGAFGEAWRAVDSNSGRRVVIKFFNSRGGLDWSLLAREGDLLARERSKRVALETSLAARTVPAEHSQPPGEPPPIEPFAPTSYFALASRLADGIADASWPDADTPTEEHRRDRGPPDKLLAPTPLRSRDVRRVLDL